MSYCGFHCKWQIYDNKELPLSQRLGIIALIPKSYEDQWFISNWLPLTLMETFYKIISATLANILKPILDKIIGNEQMAYILGGYIAECTRNYTKANNLPGMWSL